MRKIHLPVHLDEITPKKKSYEVPVEKELLSNPCSFSLQFKLADSLMVTVELNDLGKCCSKKLQPVD